jgi:DNA-binding MarR family transcriptional regulator
MADIAPVWGQNDTERRGLKGLFQVIGLLREQHQEMPAQQMQVLFYVALNEGAAQRDMCRDLDMAVSTASRNIAALSPLHRLGKPGLGLVTWVDNPNDRRAKHLKLTSAGRAFVRRVLDTL